MGIQLGSQIEFYNKLHQEWKKVNETSQLSDIFDLTLSFVVEDLGYQRALIFVHDDANGLFRVKAHRGYDDPKQVRLLSIVTLLLSGDIIEHLRLREDFIIHLPSQPHELVASLLKTLGLTEASITLFAGNANVPFGLVVVGNAEPTDQAELFSPCSTIALRNLVANLSYATNNALFYQSWHNERLHLKQNIEKRTKELNEQKETFEGIFYTSKDGIAILDVHTTAFLDANPAYLEMTEYSRAELLRTSCMALTHQDDRSASAVVMQDVLEKGFVKDFVKRCHTKSGQEISVNMSVVLMSDQQRVLVSSKDMTQRIQLETALRDAKDRIEVAHNHTLSSIEYASLIQTSLLPEEQVWQSVVRDYFFLWQPKDVVGGDIYSITQLRHKDELLIMLIDCTGHGVPGAFVTMLVKAIEQQLLTKIKLMEDIFSPARLLSSFHKQLLRMLKYDDHAVMKHVGFDGAIVCYNAQEKTLRYAGAQLPLFYYYPDHEPCVMEVIKGDRQSIGHQKLREGFQFSDHVIQVDERIRFYLTTDGYTDQLGGAQGIPLGKRKFQQALLDGKQSMAEQGDGLLVLLKQHQRHQVQTDDISVLGFEVA